ncbi:hypothetical protein SNEBB_009470 [Seison nebaliae]|nr:hypothetical protein SNEBB_009470 [Seison nebaliae]
MTFHTKQTLISLVTNHYRFKSLEASNPYPYIVVKMVYITTYDKEKKDNKTDNVRTKTRNEAAVSAITAALGNVPAGMKTFEERISFLLKYTNLLKKMREPLRFLSGMMSELSLIHNGLNRGNFKIVVQSKYDFSKCSERVMATNYELMVHVYTGYANNLIKSYLCIFYDSKLRNIYLMDRLLCQNNENNTQDRNQKSEKRQTSSNSNCQHSFETNIQDQLPDGINNEMEEEYTQPFHNNSQQYRIPPIPDMPNEEDVCMSSNIINNNQHGQYSEIQITPIFLRKCFILILEKHVNKDVHVVNIYDKPFGVIIPDGGWGWMICFASFFTNLIIDGVLYAFGVFLVVWTDYFQSKKAAVSMIGSLACGMYLMVGPVVSGLTNRYGCRIVAMIGTIIGTLAILFSTLAPNVPILTLIYGFIGGIGFGLVYIPSVIIVGFYFEKKRAMATGFAVAGSGIGTFVFAPLTEILVSEFGWKGAQILMAGIVLQCAVLACLYRPLEPPTEDEIRLREKELEEEEKKTKLKWTDEEVKEDNDAMSLIRGEEGEKPLRTNSQIFRKSNEGERRSRTRSVALDRLISEEVAKRPLARKDIFYQGSIDQLSEMKKYNGDIEAYIRDTLDIRKTDIDPILVNEDKFEEDHVERRLSSFQKFKTMMRSVLNDLCNFRLLSNPSLLLMYIGNLFSMVGYYTPYVFIVDRAVELDIDFKKASMLISIIGVTNTLGRFIGGFLCGLPFLNPLRVNNGGLFLSGIATVLCPWFTTYTGLAIYAGAYGFFIAPHISVSSPLLVSLVGVEHLSNAFGLLTLFRGIISMIGSPLAGYIYDLTENYNLSFWLGGGCIIFSGVIHSFIPCAKRWHEKKQDILSNKQRSVH